tara:strand:- start:516 stop:1646 length:1131 start_codon:yes stop_codon:yes gene_type:complete
MKQMAETKPPTRLLTLDLMRGYFMVAIILNHLQWYPSGLDWVSAQGALFVSAAEGFFLISGIILGIIRGRKLIAAPFKKAASLLLMRGVQLYIASIVLMLIFTLLGWWFFIDNPGLKPGIRPVDQPFTEVLWGALTYEYIYGWADFLRLYAIFLLISPLALWLLRIGKWYVLLTLNILVWMLFPFATGLPYSNELLMPIAWQFIFFGGMTIGFYWQSIVQWWNTRKRALRSVIIKTIVTLAISTILANVIIAMHSLFPAAIGEPLNTLRLTLEPYFNKESLPIPRLALFALWFSFGFWLFKTFEKRIVTYFGWILIPFGVNSLYVYILHAFLVFFAQLLLQGATPPFFLSLFGSLAVLGLILLAIRTKFLMKVIPR